MKTNSVMDSLLMNFNILDRLCNIEINRGLKSLLSNGIVELDGCYFLQGLFPHNFDIKKALLNSYDNTELECEINHIHINDYIHLKDQNETILIEQGILYSYSLEEILPKSERFIVILSESIDPFIDCNIRFHKIRSGEEWLVDNLDDYKEAIFVLD